MKRRAGKSSPPRGLYLNGDFALFMEDYEWSVTAGTESYTVWLQVKRMDNSLLAELYGGTHPHVGAWAAMGPETPLSSGAFGTHKELPLAQKTARDLSRAAGCHVVAVAGIHVDNASKAEVSLLCANAEDAIHQAVLRLRPASSV